MLFVSVYPTTIYFWMPGPIFMKLGMYIMAPEPYSKAYFINSSHQCVCVFLSVCLFVCLSVCLYVYPIFARQLLGKCIIAATSTHAAIEFLDAVLSMRSYQSKVGDQFFPELLVSLPQ
jgi:hypothetical protein